MSQPDPDYVDDPTIEDDSPLWRRIPPKHFVYDENLQCRRASSAAFSDNPKDKSPMSVVLGDEVLAASRTAESVLEGHEGFGLVSFLAGLARQFKQGIMRKPLDEEPAHAEVFGEKTRGVRRAFAKNCQWVIRMPDGEQDQPPP